MTQTGKAGAGQRLQRLGEMARWLRAETRSLEQEGVPDPGDRADYLDGLQRAVAGVEDARTALVRMLNDLWPGEGETFPPVEVESCDWEE